jgi:electron transfer flavoprotein alpha subunit
MRTLCCIDIVDGRPSDDSLGLLDAALALDPGADALLLGPCPAPGRDLVAGHGATRIFALEDSAFATPLADIRSGPIAELCEREGFDTLLLPTTAMTVDLAAILAARLEAGIVWGLTALAVADGALVAHRLTQGDTVVAETAWLSARRIGLARPYRFGPREAAPRSAEITMLPPLMASESAGLTLVSQAPINRQDGPSLASAQIVVSGGRGIGKPENLALIRRLASLLGGEAGVSLPLVDMGWAPRVMQVGQTGTVIKPRLYIACGISGQIQHRVGVEQAGTIIAINRDRSAPIMAFCDLAVVGDFEGVVRPLIALLEEADLLKCARG